MLKALTAAAAITICCLGNEYPAKACYSCDVSDTLRRQNERRLIKQEMENQQNLLRYQIQQQQQGSRYQ